MKRTFYLLCIVGMATMFGGAAFTSESTVKKAPKRTSACGYRIIEFGIGVNCNGDTVKLVRSNGFQRLASNSEVEGREE